MHRLETMHHPIFSSRGHPSYFEVSPWATACPEEANSSCPWRAGGATATLMRFATRQPCAEGGECSICLMVYPAGEEMSELPCGHYFHDDCLRKWLARQSSCPTCRWDGVRTSPRTMKERQQSFAADVALVREQLAALAHARDSVRTSASSCVCVVS